MTRLGADVDQLDRLARNFDNAAARLEGHASAIDWHVRNLWWSGSTADRFAASWASVDRQHLSTIAGTLREVARSVRVNAVQQRMASGQGLGFGRPMVEHYPRGWANPSILDGLLSPIGSGSLLDRFKGITSLFEGADHAIGLLPVFGIGVPRLFGQVIGGSPDIRRIGHFLNAQLTGNTRKLLGVGREFDKFLRSPVTFGTKNLGGALVSTGVHATEMLLTANEYGWEDARTIKAGFETGYVGLSTYFGGPIGGLVAEGTIFVGDATGEWIDDTFGISGAIVDGYVERTFPSGMTPSQAADLAHRYDGIDGVGRFLYDGGMEAVESVGSAVGDGLNAVGSGAKRVWNFLTPG
jgi:hypothetical protein